MVNNMKFNILFALLLAGAFIPCVSSMGTLLYPYGPGQGDTTGIKSDDGSSPSIDLSVVFHFFDTAYSTLYVNHNGVISFGVSVSQYTSQAFPLADGRKFVAPFWADVNNVAAGDIYYRQTTNPDILNQATSDINSYFPDIPFTATWVFIATWDRVAYYGSHSSQVNTLQAVLISNGNNSFILLNYEQIQWTTGAASGGDANTGLGGTPAQAGFNSGDSHHYFNIPGSRTDAILNITSTSNVGMNGRWGFRVDDFGVAGGCAYNAQFLNYGDIFWVANDCQTKCKCDNSGVVICVPQPCNLGQICSAKPPFYTCKGIETEPCQAAGDPHYKTFDGTYYDFQGTCTYVLSQLCRSGAGLEYYSVEAKNEHLGSTRVAWTRMVQVTAYGSTVTLKAGSFGKILVDGITVNLPASLSNGRVIVHQNGAYAVLETIFNLTVTYDLYSSVAITLNPEYNSRVCGLCGNYNGMANDDFILRDGSLASGPDTFAANWNSGAVSDCSHDDGMAPVCGSDIIATANVACHIIQDTNGPFASCHSAIPADPYFANCVFDQCATGGDTNALCQAIQSYIAKCQAADMNISNWRSDSFCAMPCTSMPDSHYELCGRGCQDACPTTVSNTPLCNEACVEGCFCDAGYLRSGDRCVHAAQCGCEYHGLYYNVDDPIWQSGCSQRCICQSTGNFACFSASCNANQQCGTKDGKLGCQELLTTCSVFGDPHYLTFDGAIVHFQGSCTYQVAYTCDSAADTSFQVIAENRHRGSPTVSFVYQVDFWFRNSHINVHVSVQGPRVQVNTVPTALPATIESVVFISNVNGAVLIQSPLVEIHYDGDNTLLVRAEPVNQNKLCGMCGNFNGNPNDDKVKPDGSTAWNDQEFGNSWKHGSSLPGCTDAVQSQFVGSPETLAESRSLCGIITNITGPFGECHWHENPDVAYDACVFDISNYGLANGILCRAIESYEQICKVHGVQIPEWRPTPYCPLPDPCDNITCTSNEWCGENKEGHGCLCYDTFVHQAKPNYDMTLTCDGSSSSVSMATCMLFNVNFPPNILHLSDSTCKGNLDGGKVVFPFGRFDVACGSQLRVNATHAIYSNAIMGHYIKQNGPIILQEDVINIKFSCAYPLNINLSFIWAINAVPNVINVTLPDGQGTFTTNMMLYKDELYTKVDNDNPVRLTLGQQAFMAVQATDLDTNQFVLTLSSCWATDSIDPLSINRWDLIKNQCAVPKDGSVVVLESGVSDKEKFSFNVFEFIGNSNLVYIHCRIGICNIKGGPCTPSCFGRVSQGKVDNTSISDTAVSRGPIIRVDTNDVPTTAQVPAKDGSPGSASPLFALLLMGCLIIFAN